MLALIKEKLLDACVREACALRPRRHSELSVLPVSQFHPCRYGPSGLIRVERSPAGGGFYEASIVQNILQHPGRSISTQWSRHCRSEEHTSELQSLTNLVCRLLLEKKKTTN